MTFRSLANLFIALLLAFAACTESVEVNEGKENADVTPNEQPEQQGIEVKVEEFTGDYYGDAFTQKAGFYILVLSDNGFDVNGSPFENSKYYVLYLCADFYEGERCGYVSMPEGTYTLDATNSMVKGSICKDYSYYATTDEYGAVNKQVKFEEAEIVIASDRAVLTAVVEGKTYIVTFNGQATILDKRAEDRKLSISNAWVYFYGDHDSKGVADNYYLFFSDKDTEYGLLSGATYYRIDLYSEIVDKSNGLAIPYGTYTVDENNTRAPFTVTVEYSDFVKMDKYGEVAESGNVSAGKVVVDEDGITAELHIMGGVHTITHRGYVSISDYSGSFFD